MQYSEPYRHFYRIRHHCYHQRDGGGFQSPFCITAGKPGRYAAQQHEQSGENVVKHIEHRICKQPFRRAEELHRVKQRVMYHHQHHRYAPQTVNQLYTFCHTLKRNSTMSPSFITYSLPSERTSPFSLAAFMEPQALRSSKATTSARMKPRSKSE